MYVSFGNLDKKLLITIIFPCFIKLRRIIRSKYGDEYNISMNPYMHVSFKFLSFILCGILYLIIKCRTKKESRDSEGSSNIKVKNLKSSSALIVKNIKKENKELIDLNDDANINPVKEEQIKNIKKVKRKQLLFVILLSFLQMSGALIKYIWKIEKNLSTDYSQTIDFLFQIVFLTAFSIIFLKFSIYSHQIFSLTILIICLIPYFIETYIFDKEKNKIFLILIYFFSVQILFCLSNVLGKKYLNIYIEDIFLLLFKMGSIGWIPLLLYDSIFHIFSREDSYHGIIPFFIQLFKDTNNLSKKIGLIFLDLLCSYLQEISLWLTVYYFTPCHLFISQVFGEFIDTTLKMFIDYEQSKKYYHPVLKITFYILFPIAILSVLIFNEIILLNFCGLSKNTKYQLNIRQKVDGNYDIDKSGNLIPFNNENRTTYLIEEDDEENNDDQTLFA